MIKEVEKRFAERNPAPSQHLKADLIEESDSFSEEDDSARVVDY
jgi:hypothetical protein